MAGTELEDQGKYTTRRNLHKADPRREQYDPLIQMNNYFDLHTSCTLARRITS